MNGGVVDERYVLVSPEVGQKGWFLWVDAGEQWVHGECVKITKKYAMINSRKYNKNTLLYMKKVS